jgi:hypothetical protein
MGIEHGAPPTFYMIEKGVISSGYISSLYIRSDSFVLINAQAQSSSSLSVLIGQLEGR